MQMDLERRFNILIVDNNRANRETYRRYLLQETEYTYKILAAATGEVGLELCQKMKLDGILLNCMLPGIDGLKFLQQLKAAIHSDLPAVVMAGKEDKAIAAQALAFGVEEYIVKDKINAKQLRLAMRCAIENTRLRAQLVAAEDRFRTSTENLLECFGIYSAIRNETGAIADFRIEYVNAAACATNHMTQAEQIGKGLCELLPNHRESGLFDEYCQVVETGKPLLKESFLYIDIFSGQTLVRFFDIRATKLGDGFVSSWRDVTEKKQAEAHKVLLEQASLLEQVHEAILIRDANNVITSWNRAAQKMYGWTRDEARGNVSHALLKTQLPSECHNLETTLWQEGHWDGELLHTRKDGMQIVVESRQVLVRDRQGVPVGILEVNRDITERKQVEAALLLSQEAAKQQLAEIEGIYASAPIGLCFVDTNLRYVRMNEQMAKINGFPVSAHIGRTIQEILPELADKIEPLHQQVIQSGTPVVNCEIHAATPAQPGVMRDWLASYYPLKNANGQTIGVNTVVQEITDRKLQEALLQQKNEELEQANRIKDEFLAIVSHELRSPLNPILGWSKLLQSGKLDAAKTAEALAIIERNAKLQAQLIDDLLDVSRIMQGKLSLNAVPVNLEAIVRAALETVHLAAGAKSIEIQTALESNIGSIEGDPNRLQQVIWNLLSNAVKFTPNNGRIEISLKKVGSRDKRAEGAGGAEGAEGEKYAPRRGFTAEDTSAAARFTTHHAPLTTDSPKYAQLQVTDTGKGISPKFLPYVFDSFRQENTNTTTRHGGLGLGLAIVKQLVELHGGTIDVASLGEGQGTTFTVMLPLHDQ
jgi:PAS domain S-box-containing protein